VGADGGGELAAGLIDGGLVDRLLFFIAPRVLGSAGVPVVGGAAWTLGRAPGFTFKGCKRVGEDLLIEAVPLARRGEGRDVYRVN